MKTRLKVSIFHGMPFGLACVLILTFFPRSAMTFEEGTRHITGDGVNLYFMNDKLFGTVDRHPLWAIYNCGTDIKGEIDMDGRYRRFAFTYHREGDRVITGTFERLKMALGRIEKSPEGFLYHVFVEGKDFPFSIRYEKVADGHLVNSIITGRTADGSGIKLIVNGRLCPFATTGIIMIVAGAMTVAG